MTALRSIILNDAAAMGAYSGRVQPLQEKINGSPELRGKVEALQIALERAPAAPLDAPRVGGFETEEEEAEAPAEGVDDFAF